MHPVLGAQHLERPVGAAAICESALSTWSPVMTMMSGWIAFTRSKIRACSARS